MKNVLIIGMGEFGKHLARKLVSLKNEVCIIDSNSEVVNLLSTEFTNAYVGDCMQKQTLKELGARNFDIVVVAIGQNFQASLEITSHLKELGCKYIISKAASEIQAKFLKMAGADETVYPEKDIAERIAIKVNASNIFDYIQLTEDYSMYEIQIPDAWVGFSIKELDIRRKFDVNIIAIKNNGIINLPTADYTFYKDDHIYLFGKATSALKIEKDKNKTIQKKEKAAAKENK